jgi:AraC family transcriptional regulator
LPPGLSLEDSPEATIAGGRFAVTCFKGTGAEIGAAWDRFVGECAARNLPFDASRPAFEFYPRGASFDTKTGVFSCELCYPVGS